jgi:RNA polymerase sigma factor (sigma-70 family)
MDRRDAWVRSVVRTTSGPTCAVSDAGIIGLSLEEPGRFGELFDWHGDEIMRYAAARVGAGLAEDVTAETFLAAFRHRQRYDVTRPSARPWLYGIAARQIGKHRRAEVRLVRALGRVQAETVAADFGDRSAERVTAQQLRPQLAATLAGLSSRDRELLLLFAWAELSYEELAQALDLTVSAVKSRLHRIRARTRGALGGADPARLHEPTTSPRPDQETDHG